MANSDRCLILSIYLIAQCFTSSRYYSVEGNELEVSQIAEMRRHNRDNPTATFNVGNDSAIIQVHSSTRNDNAN